MSAKGINWKIAGAAGMGIKTAGEVWAKAMNRAGKWIHGYTEYPSLIRGGHNTYQVISSNEQVRAPVKKLDILVALNQAGIDQHIDEIGKDTLVIGDESLVTEKVDGKVISAPILNEAKKLGAVVLQNTIAIGISAAQAGIDIEILKEVIGEQLADKEDLLEVNFNALDKGFSMHPSPGAKSLTKVDNNRIVLTGNEAVALGAISAGLDFFGAYPMTPASSVLHFLAAKQKQTGMIVRQTEDEISAINMCLGASFAGAKSMTGTSGGGMALMQESISLAGMLELPMVLFLAMRPGPATGMPTWTSQGDLLFAVNSGHGEFPKAVLAPGDAEEAFELTREAIDLSQKHQTIVILISDKFLAESHMSEEKFENKKAIPLQNIVMDPTQPDGEMFHRYQPTQSGVSKRTLPGVFNGEYIANSDEHDPTGLVSESAERRQIANRQRNVKLKGIAADMRMPKIYGDSNAQVSIVTWGSNKGPVLDVLNNWEGKVNLIHFTHMWPLPDSVTGLLKNKKLLSIENNARGQFAGLLKKEAGVNFQASLNKDDGRPFYSEEIIEFVERNK